MKNRIRSMMVLCAGMVCMGIGLVRQEHIAVLRKAAAICLECIGIG